MSTVEAIARPRSKGERRRVAFASIFFFNDTATTEIYTLSLHDALPISVTRNERGSARTPKSDQELGRLLAGRSEEHTSELQSQSNLVCRLLLEKNNTMKDITCPPVYSRIRRQATTPLSKT